MTEDTDRFCLLGLQTSAKPICNGKDLLGYFAQAEHNMLHFACHTKNKSHILQLSLMAVKDADIDPLEIELECDTFSDSSECFAKFKRKPLIFLNACGTGSKLESDGTAFDLTGRFIECDAGAVIATNCAVPDSFAAAFAHRFYINFLQEGKTIGEALHATRWYFLKNHKNPLGLAYGLYSPAHYRRTQSAKKEGFLTLYE